jgi:hypothetical protein
MKERTISNPAPEESLKEAKPGMVSSGIPSLAGGEE